MNAPRIRQADIAQRAGVSIPVVSRALSGRGEVAEETRALVHRIAEELGYDRRAEPRGRPASFQSNVIELALGSFDDPWASEVVAGARAAAERLGHDLVLVAERDDPADDWVERARHRRSLGVVAGLLIPTRAQLGMLSDAMIPLVMLDPRADPPPSVPAVTADDYGGGAQAARHLLDLGHREFLVITGAPAYRFGRARARGFTDTVAAVPGTAVETLSVDWNARGAHVGALAALERMAANRPSAAFCVADVIAVGVVRAAHDAGLRVPQELNVVGFDDLPVVRRLDPPLTTVNQPIREMAGAAVRLLGELIDRRTLTAPGHEVATTLIARGSTSPWGSDSRPA